MNLWMFHSSLKKNQSPFLLLEDQPFHCDSSPNVGLIEASLSLWQLFRLMGEFFE